MEMLPTFVPQLSEEVLDIRPRKPAEGFKAKRRVLSHASCPELRRSVTPFIRAASLSP
jgi:hypothetical protein